MTELATAQEKRVYIATRTTKYGSGFALGLYLFPLLVDLIEEKKPMSKVNAGRYVEDIYSLVLAGLEMKSDKEIDQLYEEVIKGD